MPISKDQAKQLYTAMKSGQVAEEDMATVQNALFEFKGRFQQIQTAKAEGRGSSGAELTDDEPGIGDDLLRRGAGALNIGATIATGAVAEPIAGIAGILSGGNADVVNAWSDAMTFSPKTETAAEMLETIAKPLVWLDSKARNIAEVTGLGNPYASTAIYTGLIGATELLSLKGAGTGVRGVKGIKPLDNLRVTKAGRDTKKAAERLGINLDHTNMVDDVIKAVQEATPNRRAEHAPELRAALQEARGQAKANVDLLAAEARNVNAYVNVKRAQDFAGVAEQQMLKEGYDLAAMPQLQKRLDEIKKLDVRSPAALTNRNLPEGVGAQSVNILDMETVRNRIEKTLVSRKNNTNLPATVNENHALRSLQIKMERFMDNEFNEAMIGGDGAAIGFWKEAHAARRSYNERYNADRSIVQLMDMDATPEQLHRWLIGGMAANAKPQAGGVLERIKELLGEDHPSVEGIRQDFIYEIAAPMLQEKPNLLAFVRNADNAIKHNKTLVDELNVDRSALNDLVKFAKVADRLPANTRIASLRDVTQMVARLFVGHGLSKAQVKVGLFANLLNMIAGVDRVSQKKILAEAANARFGQPAFNRGGTAAGRAIAAATFADIGEASGENVGPQE